MTEEKFKEMLRGIEAEAESYEYYKREESSHYKLRFKYGYVTTALMLKIKELQNQLEDKR